MNSVVYCKLYAAAKAALFAYDNPCGWQLLMHLVAMLLIPSCILAGLTASLSMQSIA